MIHLASPRTLCYGQHAEIEFPASVNLVALRWPAENGRQTLPPLAAALLAPLGYPPLRQAAVPGDRVVIALAAGVPQAEKIIAAIVPQLLAAEVLPDDISIVRTAADVAAGAVDPRCELPAAQRELVTLFTHEPGTQDQLSYLLADDQGQPVYINRRMFDADLLIPIGAIRAGTIATASSDEGDWNETLFPTFGDQPTIEHLAPSGVPLTSGQQAHRQRQINLVGWQLGVQFTVQSVPGDEDEVINTLCGAPAVVFRVATTFCAEHLCPAVSEAADLVIAGISGDGSQQSWENVEHALAAALEVVEDGGAIVLCSELAEKLGPALSLLCGDDEEARDKRLRKLRTPDAPAARRILAARGHATVYLLSRLPEETVNSLGMAFVASPEEIVRLAARHQRCILLPNAPWIWPQVAGE